MSTQQPEPDGATLSEQAVADYLHRHRDFFLRHDYLLPELELPHQSGKGTVSLVERQVSVLREQRQELKRKLQHLAQTARDNEHLLERIEQLILSLLAASDGAALLQALRHGLQEDFHADAVTYQPLDVTGRQLFDKLLSRRQPVCGHLAPAQSQHLFGKAADELASGAVIPLYDADDTAFALLAIGSVDPKRFHAEMGTAFLHYLGAVVARLLQRLETA